MYRYAMASPQLQVNFGCEKSIIPLTSYTRVSCATMLSMASFESAHPLQVRSDFHNRSRDGALERAVPCKQLEQPKFHEDGDQRTQPRVDCRNRREAHNPSERLRENHYLLRGPCVCGTLRDHTTKRSSLSRSQVHNRLSGGEPFSDPSQKASRTRTQEENWLMVMSTISWVTSANTGNHARSFV